MTAKTYLREKLSAIILYLCCAAIFAPFLNISGIGFSELLLVMISLTVIWSLYLITLFWQQRQKYTELNRIMNHLDKRYLFTELADEPTGAVDHIYFSLMHRALKAMTEHVSKENLKQTEYKQFIEQWIHEIKRPIAASKLICENNKNEYTRRIMSQIEEIDVHVERALYYARLGHVERDYLIRKISILDVVDDTLAKNKQLLIQHNACVEKIRLDKTVYSDDKWLVFILNQIILNSIQYQRDELVISIEAEDLGDQTALSIKDNGIGIKESEISRIFQHGFTGSNGRKRKSATGIGLYLCHALCTKLGLRIKAQSELNQYTCITIYFPKRAD